MAKHCNKLRYVELDFSREFTDNGIVNGLFTHCARLESLRLFDCDRVKGSFLSNLPCTLTNLSFVRLFLSIRFYLSCTFFPCSIFNI